ncbi:MAG: fibronectin type III domain-containing protein [Candidatus Eisenbacteria bacterium]|uniref:Fibronectin type III domain-containing protein n=1 Tax=Eiseniibacteriota bacterium TaxID=2212470 RepID=A0A933SDQ4_UNCEI|nr:fibronectin type III domain-containing protein [Candidatus Eisenbacteria bacterium]
MFASFRRSLVRTAAVAALLALAAPALAATRYVSPTGSDTNTGASPATAWRTISKANAAAVAGDVILVANGTYANFPNPAVNGSANARITYVGNLANPSAVVITPNGVLNKTDVTIKGMQLTGGFDITGVRDSIADCIAFGSRSNIFAADDCVLARTVVNSERFWVYGSETDSLPVAERDTIVDCTFNLNVVTGGSHTVRLKAIDRCVFARNRWNIHVNAGGVSASVYKLFWVRNCKFLDSRWDIVNDCTGACDEAGWFMQRDYTQSNFWSRDTIEMGGAGEVQFFGAGSGSFPGTVMNNTYDQVIVKQYGNPSYGGAMVYQDACKWDTLTNCTFVGKESGLLINQVIHGPTLIDHCTVVGFNPGHGAIGFDASGTWVGTTAMRSNVFYTHGSAPRSQNSSAMYMPVALSQGHLVANNNVFYGPMSKDSLIYMAGVGFSAPGVGKPWANRMLADSASTWGSPRFLDTTSVRNFNPRLGTGSRATGAGWGGSDAGSFWSTAPTPDAAGPTAVSDLRASGVSDSQMLLQWTAPADAPTGTGAVAYDLRWSNSPIDDTNFASANTLASEPVPGAPGAYQQFTFSGLSSGATYYVALRAQDKAGNWSTVSNVVNVIASLDQTPPAAIIDLSAQ